MATGAKPSETRQLIFDLGREPAFDAEDFLVSPSNSDAFDLVDRWPAWPTTMALLTGPAGSGKSHLAAIWARRVGAAIVQAQDALEPNSLAHQAAILLEDCDRSDRPDAALFHLINMMNEAGGWLLVTARATPDHWGIRTPDLLSRLRRCPAAAMTAPSPELVRAVLVKLFTERQIRIEEDIVAYAALHLDQSLEAVRSFVQAVDDASLSAGRRITRPLAAAAIASLHQDD